MIERHITYAVHPDRTTEFERFVAEQYAPAMSRSPGFVSLGLLREADDPSRYQMLMRWRDAESAVTWRTSDVHQGLQPALSSLHQGMEIVAYEVVA
jgi:heme-degrading monooxygenase HmoA